MLAILGKILGSEKVISKGMDLIDDMVVTSEEEIAAKTNARVQMLQAYHPFKVAQRYLALIFGFTFVASYIMVLVLKFAGHDIAEVQKIITTFKIDWIML